MWILGQTEMWERFSFYGMKALLVPYLILTFGLDQAAAKEVLGTYVLLVYLAPLFAGIIADRFLNLRQSIYIGALTMALGHFAMAFVPLTYVGMALIIAGNGFFKPCATNMVGQLYGQDHPWRSSAYSLFYFSINVRLHQPPDLRLVAVPLRVPLGLCCGRLRHDVRTADLPVPRGQPRTGRSHGWW